MELLGLFLGAYAVIVVIELAILLWVTIALGMVFAKAGLPAWRAWVPILNNWTYFRLGGLPGAWALFAPLGVLLFGGIGVALTAASNSNLNNYYSIGDPGYLTAASNLLTASGIVTNLGYLVVIVIVGVVATVAAHGINRGFGLTSGYTVLAFFFSPIWLTILAAGSARWQGAVAVAPAAAPDAAADDEPVPPPPAPEPFVISATPATPAAPVDRAVTLLPPPPPPPPAEVAVEAAPEPAALVESAPLGAPPPPPPRKADGSSPWQAPISDVPGRSTPPPPPPVFTPPAAPPPPPAPAVAVPVPAAVEPAAEPAAAAPAAAAPAEPVIAPRSAVSSPPAIDPDDDENDRTVVVRRARFSGAIVDADGTSVALTKPLAIVGRRPVKDPQYPDAQLVSLFDGTKTVSKNHAVLRLVDGDWFVTDLGSTNGVVVLEGETEVVVEPGVETRIAGRFILGDAEFDLRKGS